MGASTLPPICILAGGIGSRLGRLVETSPKPLLEVAGRPFLTHQLRLLRRYGATRAVLCVGYLGEKVEAALGPRAEGVELAYSFDGPGLDGTLGAIRRARSLLGERFLVLYGDTYLRLDYGAFNSAWLASGRPAAMSVLHNEGRWGPSNARYQPGLVVAYDKHRPEPGMEWIDYGLGGLTSPVLDAVDPSEPDLAELYRVLSRRGDLFGFEATDRFFEIGTPAALAETEAFLSAGGDRPADRLG